MKGFKKICVLMPFLFSCSRVEYNKDYIVKAFVNHFYKEVREEDVRRYIEDGVNELKKIDKNFELVDLNEKEVKKTKNNIELSYPFILKKSGDRYLIIKVFDYSISYQAGLKSGILNSIDLKDVSSYSPCQLLKEILSKDSLNISFNDGKADYSMIVKKELSVFPFVWSTVLSDETGYLNILSLSRTSSEFLKKNVMNLKKRGIKKLIIDLRDLSGGNYEEAANIIGYFSKDGKSYMVKSSKKGYSKSFPQIENPFKDLKVVVLVNHNTALLAEIMAASFKENGAVIVGEKTRGEFYITKLFKAGNNVAVRLTVAKLCSPSGREFDEGILPDYQAAYGEYSKFKINPVIDCDPVISKSLEII